LTNLAWKLDAVLHGRAGPRLLDSYGAERGAHVRRLTGRLQAIGAVICERDPAAARRRDAALLAEGGGEARTVTRQEIVPPLECGLLSATPGTARGTLFPQPWIAAPGGPVRFDDMVGHGWRLVLDAGLTPPAPTGLDARVASMDSLRETEGVLAAWFQRHDCRAALVRPDHYVFGTSRGGDRRAGLDRRGTRYAAMTTRQETGRDHMTRRSVMIAAVLAMLAAPAAAQWPDRPVKLLLSQPAGSGPDSVARLLADHMARTLGKPVVIDNRPGGQKHHRCDRRRARAGRRLQLLSRHARGAGLQRLPVQEHVVRPRRRISRRSA